MSCLFGLLTRCFRICKILYATFPHSLCSFRVIYGCIANVSGSVARQGKPMMTIEVFKKSLSQKDIFLGCDTFSAYAF